MASYPELKNKVALVTGANSGIGLAQTKALLQQGVKVIGLDLKIDQLTQLQQVNPNQLEFYEVDLTDVIQLKQVITNLSRIDILMNTAGKLDDYKTIEQTDVSLWTSILETNLNTMFNVTKLALPIIPHKTGIIINMASIAGMVAGGGGVAYTASKHAIIGFTKQLAMDEAPKGIRINAIAPGCIKTPMNAKDFENDAKIAKSVAKQVPIQRWAEPEEVATVSLFLASEAASYLQGAVIPVDGGWIAQ